MVSCSLGKEGGRKNQICCPQSPLLTTSPLGKSAPFRARRVSIGTVGGEKNTSKGEEEILYYGGEKSTVSRREREEVPIHNWKENWRGDSTKKKKSPPKGKSGLLRGSSEKGRDDRRVKREGRTESLSIEKGGEETTFNPVREEIGALQKKKKDLV